MNIFNQTSLTPPDRSWHSHSMVYSISLDTSRHFLQFYDNDIVANLFCSQFYERYFILHAVTIVLLLLLLRLNILVCQFGGYSTLCSIPHMQIICTFLCLGMSLFLKVRCRFDFWSPCISIFRLFLCLLPRINRRKFAYFVQSHESQVTCNMWKWNLKQS